MAGEKRDRSKVLALFDVDGTLTEARKGIQQPMIDMMKELRSKITIGTVGGSDLVKQIEQLGKTVLTDFDYCFSENGLVAYKNGEMLAKQSLSKYLGEDTLKKIINFMLGYMAKIDNIPVKRGTFIEFRNGMLNVSPIGRNCSQEERDAFEKFDLEHNIRKDFVEALKKEFPDVDLCYSIGGQISFDVFPTGWDKTYCLQFVKDDFDEIHFFGDKTFEGGNDYEIYTCPDTIGHTVTGPEDTIRQLKELFF
ncbi:Phosphomannomutase [Picochlorum sp. SENEW3]|nr:Phosphomannomutase [Picochlorum sp. SENEW3]WPT15955.1 Phosphomannomutase [Picochlorum sp. SENEW3]